MVAGRSLLLEREVLVSRGCNYSIHDVTSLNAWPRLPHDNLYGRNQWIKWLFEDLKNAIIVPIVTFVHPATVPNLHNCFHMHTHTHIPLRSWSPRKVTGDINSTYRLKSYLDIQAYISHQMVYFHDSYPEQLKWAPTITQELNFLISLSSLHTWRAIPNSTCRM